jgi:hypothetical protein
MTRFALASILVLGFSGLALGQGMPGFPGTPPNCTEIAGDFEVTSVTADTIEGTLTGDVDGTFSGTVTDTIDHTFGFGTLSMVRFSATITTATGTLEVTGRLMSITFSMPGMPGGIPLPTGSIEAMKMLVTGGTGDTEGKVGILLGVHSTLSIMLPPSFNEGYHGILCDAPAAPPIP